MSNAILPEKECELQNDMVESTSEATAAGADVKDGHYFIRMLENEIFKFEELICDFEDLGDLDSSSSDNASTSVSQIPDDVKDSILAAVGKVTLNSEFLPSFMICT